MTLMNQKALIAGFLLLSFAPGSQASAEDVVDQATIKKWIQQLDADSLTKRQKARTQLTKADQAAIPALAKAALSDKRDLIVHSIDILAEIAAESNVAKTKKAATLALEMLAESNKPSTAQRAKLALQAKKDGGIQAFPGWDKPGSEFAGRNVANRSVSVSSFNGIKTITVKEAGKTTTFQDQRSGAIRVRITGDGKPKEFAAKNLSDLKKKDPAAFALYQQYGGNGRGAKITNFGGFGGAGGFGNKMEIFGNRAQANVPHGRHRHGGSESRHTNDDSATDRAERSDGRKPRDAADP